MSLADTVSIPSTPANLGPGAKHETWAELRERRLREAGLVFTDCPICGQRATREEVLVHRPGQPSLTRVVLRCLRPGRLDHKGRTRPGSRCSVHIESETPVQERKETTPMPDNAPTLCPCGCGKPVPKNNKFASQVCANTHNSRLRRKKSQGRGAAVHLPASVEGHPRPGTHQQHAGHPAVLDAGLQDAGLLALAAQLLELTPDEADLVSRLVAAERARRAA